MDKRGEKLKKLYKIFNRKVVGTCKICGRSIPEYYFSKKRGRLYPLQRFGYCLRVDREHTNAYLQTNHDFIYYEVYKAMKRMLMWKVFFYIFCVIGLPLSIVFASMRGLAPEVIPFFLIHILFALFSTLKFYEIRGLMPRKTFMLYREFRNKAKSTYEKYKRLLSRMGRSVMEVCHICGRPIPHYYFRKRKYSGDIFAKHRVCLAADQPHVQYITKIKDSELIYRTKAGIKGAKKRLIGFSFLLLLWLGAGFVLGTLMFFAGYDVVDYGYCSRNYDYYVYEYDYYWDEYDYEFSSSIYRLYTQCVAFNLIIMSFGILIVLLFFFKVLLKIFRQMQLAGKILQKYDRTAFRNLDSGFQYTPQGSYQQGHQQMYQQTYQNKSPEQQPNQPQQHNPKNFAQNQLNPQQQRYFESQQHQQQRTQTSMNNSTREFNEADLQKLQKLFKISSRVKISDVEQIANLERAQIINILIENSENLKGIKIEGDELVVEKEGDVSNFMDVLDTQFDGWEQREHNKEGKVEEFGNWEE